MNVKKMKMKIFDFFSDDFFRKKNIPRYSPTFGDEEKIYILLYLTSIFRSIDAFSEPIFDDF